MSNITDGATKAKIGTFRSMSRCACSSSSCRSDVRQMARNGRDSSHLDIAKSQPQILMILSNAVGEL